MTEARHKVIIVGGGIAGPVLAFFLKRRGYDPVVYERRSKEEFTEGVGGIGLMLQPNGLRVLSLIPGLVSQLPGCPIHTFKFTSNIPEDSAVLATVDVPGALTYGFGVRGVLRAELHTLLVRTAEKEGVPVHFGCHVVGLEQAEESVQIKLEDGSSDTASFVVGCDGLHSIIRTALFGNERAAFTGLTQTGGTSPIHVVPELKATMMNIFGDNAHLVTYRAHEEKMSWAITLREPEALETWRHVDEEALEAFKKREFSEWPYGGGELVKNATKIIKYGLYDRPELKTWHSGRVVLLGDAAHPTSPHLGQGANQAFEDIYHLTLALLTAHPSPTAPLPTSVLSTAFAAYDAARIPRSSALVKGARAQGETRVLPAGEAGRARNDAVRRMWSGEGAEYTRTMETLQRTLWAPWEDEPAFTLE